MATIDEEKSVYVGGLPYHATEDTIRNAFDFYGRVVLVKIVNEGEVGGQCYGFVTFTNPRSIVDAIGDMNGRKIDGRVVKVSKVKTRNGRSNFGRDSFRRNLERGSDWDRGRDRDRNHDRDRYHKRPRERSSDCSQGRKRGYNSTRDLDGTRSHLLIIDKDRDLHGNVKDIEQEPDRKHELQQDKSLNSDSYQDKEVDHRKNQLKIQGRSREKDADQISKSLNV